MNLHADVGRKLTPKSVHVADVDSRQIRPGTVTLRKWSPNGKADQIASVPSISIRDGHAGTVVRLPKIGGKVPQLTGRSELPFQFLKKGSGIQLLR